MRFQWRRAGLALLVLLASCGGGGHAFVDFLPAEPTVLRSDLFYGYYLNTSKQQALDVADHVNLVHEALDYGAYGIDDVVASMKAHGKRTMLLVTNAAYKDWPNYVPRDDADAQARLAAVFDRLRTEGLLSSVVALYPMDEPEAQHLGDAQVRQANANVRAVASRYPELAGVKLAVIYGTNRGFAAGSPGFSSYDWIGADDYDMGPGVLISPYWLDMMAALRPGQQVMLVPGGAAPWKTDPEAFRRYAHEEPRVAGILPFLWHHPEPGHELEGIDSNGAAAEYRAVGKSILAAAGTTNP